VNETVYEPNSGLMLVLRAALLRNLGVFTETAWLDFKDGANVIAALALEVGWGLLGLHVAYDRLDSQLSFHPAFGVGGVSSTSQAIQRRKQPGWP
jgi:hypothetical protein